MIATLHPRLTAEQRLRLELEDARAALEAETAARRRLEAAVVAILDAERHRLGRILHDTACQSLNGICLLSRIIRRKLEREPSPLAPDITELCNAIDDTIREAQCATQEWQLSDGEGIDLISALARLADDTARIVPCQLQHSEEISLPEPRVTTQLLQIIRQAICDAVRRPGLTGITITLSMQNRLLALIVEDDGQPGDSESSDALPGCVEIMRLRASTIGACLTHSQSDKGTRVTCILALPS